MSMTAMNLGASLGAEGIPAAPARARKEDLSALMARLFAETLKAGVKVPAAAIHAVGAIWGWFKQLINKVAQLLGVQMKVPEQLTERQAQGLDPIEMSVEGDLAKGVSAETAASAILDEARRLCDHLVDSKQPLVLVESEEGKMQLQSQFEQLAALRRALQLDLASTEKELEDGLEEAAKGMGDVGARGLKSLLRNGSSDLSRMLGQQQYDHFRKLFADAEGKRAAVRRVEVAAATLVQACRSGWKDSPRFADEVAAKAMPGLYAPPDGMLFVKDLGAAADGIATEKGKDQARKQGGGNVAGSVAPQISSDYNAAQANPAQNESLATAEDVQAARKSPFAGLGRGRIKVDAEVDHAGEPEDQNEVARPSARPLIQRA